MTAPILEEAPENGRRRHRLSAHIYEQMALLGQFEGVRVELIDGEVIEMLPMGEPHAASVTNTTEELVVPLHGKMKVRNQTPLNAGLFGRPEPDVAVASLESLLPDLRWVCPVIGLSTCKKTCWKCATRPSNGPLRVLALTIR